MVSTPIHLSYYPFIEDDWKRKRESVKHSYMVICLSVYLLFAFFFYYVITPKVFLKEVKCLRILRWRDQQVSSSISRLYVLEEELMNKLTSKVQYCATVAPTKSGCRT